MSVQFKNYGLVGSTGEFTSYVDRLVAQDLDVGFDIETGYHGAPREEASLHPETAFTVGFSFTNSTEWARYVPLGHDAAENLDVLPVARDLWRLLTNCRIVAHNAKFERRHLAVFFRKWLWDDPVHGPAVRAADGYWDVHADSMVEAYLVAELKSFGLKPTTFALFGHSMRELHELFPDLPKNKRKTLRFNTLPLSPEVVAYACEDALWSLAIHQLYHPRVKDMFLYRVEMAVIPVLCEMEDFGVLYDWAYMAEGAREGADFMAKLNAEIQVDLSQALGEPVMVNLGSSQQLSKILYERMGLSTTRMTKGSKDKPGEKKMSTDKIALGGLAKDHPTVRKIVWWKGIKKLVGTYLEKYQGRYDYAPDGRAHPNHMQTAVITGRFAVDGPPYQQCLSGDVEVLTRQGWARLDVLTASFGHGARVEVAQFVPAPGGSEDSCRAGDGIEFVEGELVAFPYAGEMVRVQGARELQGAGNGRVGEGGTWLYTPDHRMFYRKRTRGGMGPVVETVASEWESDLLDKRVTSQGRRLYDRRVPRAGHRVGGVRLSPEGRAQLRLAVAVQADGSRTQGRQYDLEVYKARKVSALRGMGLSPAPSTRGSHRLRVPDHSVGVWLDDNKDFVAEEVLSLCEDDLRWFVSEVMAWDGDATREATYGQKVSRRASVDVVQAAAALCGMSTSLYSRPEFDAVTVNVTDRQYRESGWQSVDRVPSPDGHVYCVTVPSGAILVRNAEGVVQVTGNTPKKYFYELDAGDVFEFRFREAIIAPPDHYMLGFDLGQAELRAIAGEAKEKALLKAFANNEDVHSRTAALMLGIPIEQVTEEIRAIGKTFNFAIVYGMSVQGLAERLACSVQEAQQLFDQYFMAYPALAGYFEAQKAFGRQHGYVMSRFGRRLPIWEFESDQRWIREKGERACVNYPIQGAATGDYMKIAMVRARKAIQDAGLADRVHLVMNVHDALEFYVHRSVDPQLVINVLQPAVIFDVPGWPTLVADWHIGTSWGRKKELELSTDGTIRIKGSAPEPEPVTDDPDIAEDEVELPSVSAEALASVLGSAPLSGEAEEPESRPVADRPVQAVLSGGDGVPRNVVVQLTDLPTQEEYLAFMDLASSSPGPNTVILRTAHGEVVLDIPGGTTLCPADQPAVAIVVPGARVFWDAADVPVGAIVGGLAL